MDDNNGGSKLTGIRQIVRLKEILQKWQAVTLGAKANTNNEYSPAPTVAEQTQSQLQQHGGISPAITQRLKNANIYCDSDEESCHSPEPPHGVPRGYLAVYVGPELRRFIIPTSYLSNPVFKVLLEKVEEEFGFDHSGGLTFPCDIETFKYLLKYMETHSTTQEHDSSNSSSSAGTSIL
ncbi:auxin-responsive protein SAUR41-like [Impatiens glandulifera]|uniref:auxin-responsive protein SAUR41-like n=1 Tax=Impatiens glandulifera TaxID=253017 RepID=UPI001FB17CEA|nr:auxin-responsive protein SAUR41-like [Impatiens glandulifera]XP_047336153.1 auxin-responsive protein SAUR41-like [Impatiens glandulifera]